MKRYYGYKKNPKDSRDFRYKVPMMFAPPAFSDLKPIVLPVEDQGPLGSCVGNGGTTQLETMWVRMGRPFTQMSRLGLYWLARYLADNVNNDDGCYPRDMAKALVKYGCPRESLHPYLIDRFREKPSPEAMEDALNYRVEKYYWPRNAAEIKWALSLGYPVGVGIRVFKEFENPINGIVSMPEEDEEDSGLHWIDICGHSDPTQYYDIVNSWGTSWGIGGFAKVPYKYIEKYGSDFLVLELGIKTKLGEEPWQPDHSSTVWYVPLTTIWRVIVSIFSWGKK